MFIITSELFVTLILMLHTLGRKVIDGVKVYSLDELGVGKGGDTPDCPFDCDCCF